MIPFVCSSCDKWCKAKDELAGQRVRCRRCGAANVTPDADPAEIRRMAILLPAKAAEEEELTSALSTYLMGAILYVLAFIIGAAFLKDVVPAHPEYYRDDINPFVSAPRPANYTGHHPDR
jgi:hypothetical protein